MSSTLDLSPIVNTSPLLYLHQVQQLSILPLLYGAVRTPNAVEEELAIGAAKGVDVPDLRSLSWLEVQAVESESKILDVIDLGRGEAEVIALGRKTPNSLLILDDQLGRRLAVLYKLRTTGTLGILIKAKQAGHLSAIAPIIAKLQVQGMWLSEPVIQQALRLAME